ncbi:MAG: prephenate dehydrogenase [Bacteroidales bacterium]|jgi:prephenate dehydrogenase|nr:prephenate dehydrogenase [Bacteroidales bacterium]
MTIAVVGIGLIGGSLMLDLRKRGFADKIIGVDSNLQHQNIALLCGIIDEADTLDNAIYRSDLILLCTPVDSNCDMLPGILDRISGTSKVVADMGSTKGSIAEISKDHPQRGRYVATHPMAGTEYSGPLAAIGKLFDYKTVIICDPELSDPDANALIEKMLKILNMRIVYMNSALHDVHVAYVSHISHITSFSLALSVLEKEQEEENILTLAGGGFESTVRLAKSNGDTWAPIFSENSKYIIEAIDTYIEKMNIFKKLISGKDTEGLKSLMEEANKIRKILN